MAPVLLSFRSFINISAKNFIIWKSSPNLIFQYYFPMSHFHISYLQYLLIAGELLAEAIVDVNQ